jgi:peptidoglycan hydrolase-like protein with peptidoglycan-binding domain
MATYVYDDFRVTFTARDDGSFDVLAADADGGIAVGVFSLPLSEAELEQAVLDVATARAAARRTRKATPVAEVPAPTTATITRDVGGSGPPPVDVERLGRLIAEALFNGEIGTAYESARGRAETRNHGLRLSLALAAAPALLSVPWEFLYRPPRFLASQRRSPLVRVLEASRMASPPTVERSVRVLGVVASPRDLPPLDVGAERERMVRALEPVRALGRVELEWLEPASPGGLRRALRDGTYHVVHYVGHSDFTEHGDGILYLEGADGNSVRVDETLFANLLSDQATLRLVVLNSCEGARTTLTDPYAGVATTLVRLGVPAVVAMQFEISDGAAILFAEELYTNLIGRQDPIDAAIGEARKAIYAEIDSVEWATPVLFLSDPDVELFRFEVEAAPLPPPDPPGEPAADAQPDASAASWWRRWGRWAAAAAAVGLVAVAGLLVWRAFDDDSPTGALATTTTSTTTQSAFPSVSVGSEGTLVEAIQRLLTQRGFPVEASGFFDDATEDAVRQFEDSVGIPADGLVARLTWQQLVVPVKRGQEGEAVRALQLLLTANGFPHDPDGRFTLDVQEDVVAVQRSSGLNVDGIPDVDTWRVLLAGAQGS